MKKFIASLILLGCGVPTYAQTTIESYANIVASALNQPYYVGENGCRQHFLQEIIVGNSLNKEIPLEDKVEDMILLSRVEDCADFATNPSELGDEDSFYLEGATIKAEVFFEFRFHDKKINSSIDDAMLLYTTKTGEETLFNHEEKPEEVQYEFFNLLKKRYKATPLDEIKEEPKPKYPVA